MILFFSLFACERREPKRFELTYHHNYNWADSLILREGIWAGDSVRANFLVDSLRRTGDLNKLGADVFHIMIHQAFKQVSDIDFDVERMSRHAITHNSPEEQQQWYYDYAVNSLAYQLYMTHNYEGFLHVALPIIASMESSGTANYRYMTDILTMMACCYVKLDQPEKAKKVAARARSYCWDILEADSSIGAHQSLINSYARVKDAYVMVKNWKESKDWFELVDSVEQVFRRRHPEAPVWEIYDGYIHLDRATKLWIMGQTDSASIEYDRFRQYEVAYDWNGMIQSNDYLMPAERWREAADNYEALDAFVQWRVPKVYLEEISAYFLPKFRANINAGRDEAALATAKQIAEYFDSAYVWHKRSQMAEMATLYDIKGKEMQIAKQKASLLHERVIALMVAIVLLIVFFAFYVMLHRRSAARMKAVNQQLETLNTELAQKNQELTAASARAEEASRMKTEFIQQISHEIRTPLNILSGFAQLITSDGVDMDEASRRDANHQILVNTDRITSLVNKMLDLSDINSRTQLDLSDQVSPVQIATVSILTSGIDSAPHLCFQMLTEGIAADVMLTTNQHAAMRALSLLLDNACKFTAPADVHAQPQPAPSQQQATLTIRLKGDNIQFIVEDTGIGIPATEAEHVFDEFVQLNEYYEGTGIGLTVARSLTRRLGGDIVLDTTYTAGARFVMTLPM